MWTSLSISDDLKPTASAHRAFPVLLVLSDGLGAINPDGYVSAGKHKDIDAFTETNDAFLAQIVDCERRIIFLSI